MILRFLSGSVTPASFDRKRSLASTTRRSALKASRNSDSTCAASLARCRPVSTKMQVSRAPIALSTSAAATDESTPPDRPQTARACRPDARFDGRDRLADEPGHRPVRRGVADPEQEVGQDLAAARGVRHLGVELHAPELARRRGDRGRRTVGALAHQRESGRQRVDAIAVRHPDRDLLARAKSRGTRSPVSLTCTVARPYSRRSAGTTLPPSSSAVSWVAVADAEDRHAQLVDLVADARRVRVVAGRRTARQDDPARRQLADARHRQVEGVDLRVDLLLAHAARDELGVLPTEVEDEDEVAASGHGHSATARRGSWAPLW